MNCRHENEGLRERDCVCKQALTWGNLLTPASQGHLKILCNFPTHLINAKCIHFFTTGAHNFPVHWYVNATFIYSWRRNFFIFIFFHFTTPIWLLFFLKKTINGLIFRAQFYLRLILYHSPLSLAQVSLTETCFPEQSYVSILL